jgi:hypothetical protein
MTWSFDMSAAPRGKLRLQPTGRGSGTRKVPERAEIVVAGACGTVTVSHWLDDERRWEFFTRDVPPIAWMEKPAPVEIAGKDGPRMVVVLPAHPKTATSWFDERLARRAA